MRGQVALVVLAALAVPGAALARTEPPRSDQPQYDRPARPILESGGQRIRAARGSSCWTTYSADGTGTSICGDLAPPRTTKKKLRVRPGGVIKLDMRMPTLELHAWLGSSRKLKPKRLDDDGEHWKLRLPKSLRRKPTLHLLARYTQGDSGFAAALRRTR